MNAGSIDGNAVLAVAENAEIQAFDEGGVILNVETGQLYSCNRVTMAYLNLLDGERSIDVLAAALADDYSVPVSEVRSDLIEVSGSLLAEQLLTVR